MSTFETRRDAAIAQLQATGMRTSDYLPPFTKALWALGIEVRPPHFAGFAATALCSGTFFALGWGCVMWLLRWRLDGTTAMWAGLSAALAGLIFGLAMAAYYAHGRSKYKLPAWDSL